MVLGLSPNLERPIQFNCPTPSRDPHTPVIISGMGLDLRPSPPFIEVLPGVKPSHLLVRWDSLALLQGSFGPSGPKVGKGVGK